MRTLLLKPSSAPKPRVFVTRRIPEQALGRLLSIARAEVWRKELPPPYETLRQKARQADGLLTLLTDRVDGLLLEEAPRLRVVSNLAVGYDNIDVATASQRGILVTNTPGVLTEATADFAFGLLLAAARRIVEADRLVRRGRWRTWGPMILLGAEVHHKTLGIVGFGRIGQAMARRARGFSMSVLYHSRHPSPEAEAELGAHFCPRLETLLAEADFVSLHVPLTQETYHLIGERELALMKPEAILVNTTRGPVVDQRALCKALQQGKIAGAALDVTDPEPIAPDDPLLRLSNVVVAPHIASAGRETRTRMALMAVANLEAALSGQRPPHLVNPEALKMVP